MIKSFTSVAIIHPEEEAAEENSSVSTDRSFQINQIDNREGYQVPTLGAETQPQREDS